MRREVFDANGGQRQDITTEFEFRLRLRHLKAIGQHIKGDYKYHPYGSTKITFKLGGSHKIL
jgi:hypothetical protein